jgi:hypothetical protein
MHSLARNVLQKNTTIIVHKHNTIIVCALKEPLRNKPIFYLSQLLDGLRTGSWTSALRLNMVVCL